MKNEFGKNVTAFKRLFKFPQVRLSRGLFAIGLFALVVAVCIFVHPIAGLGTLALAPAIKFKKDGLDKDSDGYKYLEILQSRLTVEGELGLSKEEVTAAIDAKIKSWEGLDAVQLKALLDGEKGVMKILAKQGEDITAMKGQIQGTIDESSIRSQVEAWHTKNKDAIQKIKAGGKADLPMLEIKAANSPMTPANTLTSTVALAAGSVIRMGGDVFDIHRTQPTFWDFINKGRTGLETYPWVNKKVPAASGAAAFIGPGVAKPGISFTFDVEKSNAKKIAVSMKVATELLDDIDGMTTYIQVELAYQLKIQLNSDLMTGVLSATKVAGVQTYSLLFTTNGLSTTNPNNWDVCRSIVAQIRLAFINSPIVIFMNPIDTANMDMEKAVSQGSYMGLNIRQVPGAIIVEDYNIPVGYVQAIAIDCLKTLIYKDFNLQFGWENDDFTKNQITAIAEMRLHSFHSANDAAAFVYCAISDVKAQIAAA